MDSLEAFFDEYAEFMEEYANSDDVTSLMGDYTEYLSKYAEMMGKLEAIDESTLNEEEAIYYAEVAARISEKMLGTIGEM